MGRIREDWAGLFVLERENEKPMMDGMGFIRNRRALLGSVKVLDCPFGLRFKFQILPPHITIRGGEVSPVTTAAAKKQQRGSCAEEENCFPEENEDKWRNLSVNPAAQVHQSAANDTVTEDASQKAQDVKNALRSLDLEALENLDLEALENLDLILLCLDDKIVDGGMMLETSAPIIAEKVTSHNLDSDANFSDQKLLDYFMVVLSKC
ncbi:hypothetical protein K1719_023395 [Acacia pycnantha]|nr:hypothetical protein K1719_023395 [Acacia pycnantha]